MKSINKYYNIGKDILFPICRSITGKGTLKSLQIIKKEFSLLKIKKVRSQSRIFDWKVPYEWHIHDAYLLHLKSKKNMLISKKIIYI